MESSAATPPHPPVPQPLYGDAGTTSAAIARYKPLRGPARAAALMLGAIVLIDLAAVWSGLLELDLLQRLEDGVAVSDDELTFNDSRQASIGIAQLVLYLMTAAVFIFWFHRAYRNVDAVAGPFARNHGTGWAIGGWFVPILGLWRPKQIANDIWAAGARHDSQREPGWLLRLWWIGFVISWFLGRVAGSGAGDEQTPGDFEATTKQFLVSDGFDFFVAILAILVVSRITRRMEAKAAAGRERDASGTADGTAGPEHRAGPQPEVPDGSEAARGRPAPQVPDGSEAARGRPMPEVPDGSEAAARGRPTPQVPDGSEAAGGRASVAQPWTTPPTT